jgi:hypothetical protein
MMTDDWEPTELEKEIWELEQQLDIPMHARYHNRTPKREAGEYDD